MKIFVSGLTAAGKTTHSRLLAETFGLRYFCMLDILSSRLGASQTRWTPRFDGRDPEVDLGADRLMVQLATTEAGGVFDAWALPWLYAGQDAISVWIESSPESRLNKAKVSEMLAHMTSTAADGVDLASLLEEKDHFSRRRFYDLYGFDLYTDRSPFNLVLDNGPLMPSPSCDAAIRGVALFHVQLLDALSPLLSKGAV